MRNPLVLDIVGLTVELKRGSRSVTLVNGLTLQLPKGQSFGLVGESGSGKSMTCRAILKILPSKMTLHAQRHMVCGEDLAGWSETMLTGLRGRQVGYVTQDPMSGLNPVLSIGAQVAEALKVHQDISRREAARQTLEILNKVGLPDPRSVARAYPHELSGGMRQRVMIGIAISNEPELLIADEPTTSLDVTVQAQILRLLKRLQSELGMALLLVTHSFGVVGEMCEYVSVMYGGFIVESGATEQVFTRPLHPYTAGLLACVPDIDRPREAITAIPGGRPSPWTRSVGCVFAPRCANRQPDCVGVDMSLRPAQNDRSTACIHCEQTSRLRT